MNQHSTAYCILFTVFLFIAAGCQMATPPRLATVTAQAAWTPTPTPKRLELSGDGETAAPTPQTQSPPQAEPNPAISVWVNETSPAHETALQQMAEEFTAAYQIDVAFMFVSPQILPDLVNTAILSGTLPDIIIHPLEYTSGWVEKGILNGEAAETAVSQIGRQTFDPQALELVTVNGRIAALPSDGTHQIILYRSDWFAEANLPIPDDYESMIAAAEATNDPENMQAGFVIPTESNLVTTHHAFEQIALANGCEMIDEKGEALLLEPACLDALNFYYSIVNQFSPIGVQTDTSTRNAYLDGRTGLIMASSAILPQIAGLDQTAPPTCRECGPNPAFLAENSGIVTEIKGSGETAVPAGFSNITNLGITTAADTETAVAFANYWFNEGYDNWLAVSSERKVPLHLGTEAEPRQFIDAWGTTPLADGRSLNDIFGAETVNQLREGIAAAPRWGINQGQGGLMTQLYEDLTFSVTLQEMLSGYFNPEQTILEAYIRVTDKIPNYQYYLEREEVEDIEEEG
ncbi:MAG: extracellular solute-binding protein [Chloroflexi bacterium]|nr:extracellular solute-binding protein [Chloroflexota bacterium]